jgi:hypothetical protein
MEKNGSVPSSDAKYNCAAFFPNHLNGAPLSACTARTAHDTHSAVRALDPRATLAGAPTSSDSCPIDVFLPLVTVLDLDDALDRVTIVVVVVVTARSSVLARPPGDGPTRVRRVSHR